MKKLFVFLAMLMPMVASAYDFMVDGIAYKLVSLSDLTCEVAVGSKVNDGVVNIKNSVEYKGKTFSVIGIGDVALVISMWDGDIRELNIEEGITYIGENSFFGKNLSKIVIPNSVKEIRKNAFGCVNNIYDNGTKILPVEFVVEDGEDDIAVAMYGLGSAFYSCNVKKAYIGRNLSAGLDLSLLEDLTFGDNVTEFFFTSEYTGLSSIKNLVIGTGFQEVPSFKEGDQLESIYLKATTPQAAVGFSDNTYLHTTLYVPKGTKELYEKADVWKNFWTIEEGSIEDRKEMGYAVFDSSTGTLTFKYGVKPSGDNVYETDDTSIWFSPAWTYTDLKKVVFDSSYQFARPKSTAYWFAYAKKLSSVENMYNLNTSCVENMSYMFHSCESLRKIDVSWLITNNVTTMRDMFSGSTNLESISLGNFNTSHVTDLSYMFENCSSIAYLDLSKFRTDNVNNMKCMFNDCKKLSYLDISTFETGNVTEMAYMFSNCETLKDLNVSGFNTSKVTTMNAMFQNCKGLTSLDVSKFETGSVKDMGFMFSGCQNLSNIDVSHFDMGNVTKMKFMFQTCLGLTSLDLSSFDTGKVTEMEGMFNNCLKLSTIYVSDLWTTANVESDESMFMFCNSLVGGNGTEYNSSNEGMSYACIDGVGGKPGYFTQGTIVGDVNDDGKRDYEDVKAVESYIMGIMPTKFLYTVADMNGDDKINVIDIVRILKLIK